MPRVYVPAELRDQCGGRTDLQLSGNTVRELIAAWEQVCPGVAARLCDQDGLRSGLAVSVAGQISRKGLRQVVGEQDEVHFLPAIGGG